MKKKILAVFLSLCMAMSLLPVTALAAEDTGSETRVKTVEQFQAAVATSGTVILDEDIIFSTDDITEVPANVTLVLDMNGHSITVEDNFTGRPIVNYGALTVTGNGTIDSTSSEFGGYGAINNFGTLTIENGTYKGHVCADGAAVYNREGGTATINGGYFEGCRAVNNAGTMTIKDGTFYTTSCNLTEDSNHNKNHWSYCVGSTGTLYFYGGTVTGVQGGLAVYDGYAEVYGGTFETVACDHAKDGSVSFYPLYVAGEEGEVEAHIYGGSYTAAYRYAVYCGNDNDGGIKEQATLYIHDGSFVGGYNVQAAVFQAEDTGNPSITGGTFQYKDSDQKIYKSDISVFLPEGAALEQDPDGAVITDVEMAASAVAEVNGVPYTSLQSALNMARDGDTVTLLKDETLNATITVDKTVTIDLNQRTVTGDAVRAFHVTSGTLTLTGTGTVTSTEMQDPNSSVIRVGNNGTAGTSPAGLVVGENVVIKAPGTYGISVFGNATEETLTVNGTVTATGPAPAISGNGMYDGTTITIGETANISASQSVAIYHPQGGTLTINGGTITGGIEAKSGDITINGNPSISAVGEKNHTANGNGPSTTGYAIAIVDNSAYDDGATITINGGSYNGPVEYLKDGNGVGTGNESGSITVSGGHFSAPVSQEYLANTINAELYSLRNPETPYSYYPTVEDARTAAQPGDVVTDLSDVDASTTTRYDVVFHQ